MFNTYGNFFQFVYGRGQILDIVSAQGPRFEFL